MIAFINFQNIQNDWFSLGCESLMNVIMLSEPHIKVTGLPEYVSFIYMYIHGGCYKVIFLFSSEGVKLHEYS